MVLIKLEVLRGIGKVGGYDLFLLFILMSAYKTWSEVGPLTHWPVLLPMPHAVYQLNYLMMLQWYVHDNGYRKSIVS